MKDPSSRVLRILLGIYLFLYLVIEFIIPLLQGVFQPITENEIQGYIIFLIPLIGFSVSWFNKKNAGVLLLIWVLTVWVFSLFVWTGTGMILIVTYPVIPLAVLFIRNWYASNPEYGFSKQKLWKLVLQLLLISYSVLYLIYIISEFIDPRPLDFTSATGAIAIAALILYFIAFYLSWKSELISGILFICWYALVLLNAMTSFEFAIRGFYTVLGLAILVQGILYIYYYKVIRSKDAESGS